MQLNTVKNTTYCDYYKGGSKQGPWNIHPDRSEMGASVLETRLEAEVTEPSGSNSQSSSPSDGCNAESSSSKCSKPIFGGLENTGWAHITNSWSKEDCELLERSWRKSSLKTYAAPWKLWITRCQQLHMDPNNPDSGVVTQHLGFLHRVKQFSPGTIKLHKSVIATLANP